MEIGTGGKHKVPSCRYFFIFFIFSINLFGMNYIDLFTFTGIYLVSAKLNRVCPYFERMKVLFGEDPLIRPVVTMDSTMPHQTKEGNETKRDNNKNP
jgi:hypothetical protein